MRRLFGRFEEEEGVAMTEFAIMLPVLVMLMTYSIFFTDLMQVRLKSLEVARMVTWEKTANRNAGEINTLVTTRFKNLRSYDEGDGDPNFLLGVDGVQITVSLEDDLPVNMLGAVPSDDVPSWASGIVDGVGGAIDQVLGYFKFNTNGMAKGTASIQVANRIIPNVTLAGQEILPSSLTNPLTFTSHSAIVYDTWKAWPNPKKQVGFAYRGADPMSTYRLAEDVTVAQVKEIAFYGLSSASWMDKVNDVITSDPLSLPSPLSVDASNDNEGPITMLPSSRDVASYSPSRTARPATRFGDRYSDTKILGQNANPGVDRSRYSLPYRINSGHWWNKDGGAGNNGFKEISPANPNAYSDTWACRGHFYDGMIVEDGKPGDPDNYESGCDANPGSGIGSVDDIGGGLPDISIDSPGMGF